VNTFQVPDRRPHRLDDFAGEHNRRRIREVFGELRAGRWLKPLMLTGVRSAGKTSACRLIAAAVCCPAFPAAGEPCGRCEACLAQRPAYNGDRHGYRHWELDCAAPDRRGLHRALRLVAAEPRAVVTLDEMAALTEPADQRALLKFVEEFPGVLLAAVGLADEGEAVEQVLIEPLARRFRRLRLRTPTEDELVAHFAARVPGLACAAAELRLMVRAAGRDFRRCQDVLDRAAAGGALTRRVIADALDLPDDWDELAD
jgi:hypothetical protein